MREIKYKAKRLEDGEWIEGSFIPQYHSSKQGRRIDAIFWSDVMKTYRQEVYTNTLSTWLPTPSLNIDGIWIGSDIFEFDYITPASHGRDFEKSIDLKGVVFYDKSNFTYYVDAYELDGKKYDQLMLCGSLMSYFKIIGNIFDNPDLLTKTGDK